MLLYDFSVMLLLCKVYGASIQEAYDRPVVDTVTCKGKVTNNICNMFVTGVTMFFFYLFYVIIVCSQCPPHGP